MRHVWRFRHAGKGYIAYEGGVPGYKPGTLVATGYAVSVVADGHRLRPTSWPRRWTRSRVGSKATGMIPDVDIWHAALLLLKRHGSDAAIVAAQRADECFAAGDMDGQRIWKAIVDAILDLLRHTPDEGERVN